MEPEEIIKMETDQIVIDNMVIGKYMGGVFTRDYRKAPIGIPVFAIYAISPHDLKYHSSWDWLVPVYSKIMCQGENDDSDDIYNLQSDFENAIFNDRIGWAFNAIVEFLKLYNTKHHEK